MNPDRTELRITRTTHPRHKLRCFFSVLFRSAVPQPSARRRIHRHPFRQRHDQLLQVRRREPFRVVVGLRDRLPQVEAGRRGRAARRRFQRQRRFHRQPITPHHRTERHPFTQNTTRFLPRIDLEFRFQRSGGAHRRVREERRGSHFGGMPEATEAARNVAFPLPAQRVMGRAGRDPPQRERDRRDRSETLINVREGRRETVVAAQRDARLEARTRPDQETDLRDFTRVGSQIIQRLDEPPLGPLESDCNDPQLVPNGTFFLHETRTAATRGINQVTRKPARQQVGHVLGIARERTLAIGRVERDRRRDIGVRTSLVAGQRGRRPTGRETDARGRFRDHRRR